MAGITLDAIVDVAQMKVCVRIIKFEPIRDKSPPVVTCEQVEYQNNI